jgi:hypothetical protein
VILLTALAALTLSPAAQTGCWATVQLSSLPTARTWEVDVRPLQHGRTPLPKAKPRIEISRDLTSWTVFRSRRTPRSGYFHVSVRFPAPGRWNYRVWDGFEPTCASYHAYAGVTIP